MSFHFLSIAGAFMLIFILFVFVYQLKDKHPVGCTILFFVFIVIMVKACGENDKEEAEKERLEQIRRQSEADRRMREWEREWRERMKRDEEAAREPAKTGDGSEEVKFWEWGEEQ